MSAHRSFMATEDGWTRRVHPHPVREVIINLSVIFVSGSAFVWAMGVLYG